MSWNPNKARTNTKKLQIKQTGIKKDSSFAESHGGESRISSLQSDEAAVNSKSTTISATDVGKNVKVCAYERNNPTESSVTPERSQKTNAINPKTTTSGGNHTFYKEQCYSTSDSLTLDRSQYKGQHKSTSDSLTSGRKHIVTHKSSPSSSTHHQRTPEKVPYFIDEVRERDRLRRKYGALHKLSSSYTTLRSRRSRSNSRSHHRSSNRHRTYRSRSPSRDRFTDNVSRRNKEQSSRNPKNRHKSRERECSRHRSRSFDSYSRSRSRSLEYTGSRAESSRNERRKYRHGEHDKASNADLVQRSLPQIITIPVPVPADFLNYSYPAWPTSAQWNAHLAPPSPYSTRAAYPAILPGNVMRPIRPPFPPYGLPHPPIHYGGHRLRFHPQYGASRPWQTNIRGRNT